MNKKTWRRYYLLFPVLIAFLFTGCMKDKITKTYKISTPIFEVLTKFRDTIKSLPAMDIEVAGKITIDGNYIYLTEPYKGIHVIDNSNPASPKNVSFINIPGNEDMAITGKTLYADAYGDLVTFDISNPLNVVAKNFATNVFPDHSIYYFAPGIHTGIAMNPDSINVIVGYSTRDTTVDYNPAEVYPVYGGCPYCAYAAPASMAPVAAVPDKTATNGSTARFSIINKFLYTVGYSTLTTFDISSPFVPAQTSTVQIDPHVETIYPLKNRLFVGSNNGMFMYDVQSTPSAPALIGQFTHVRGCDPVIADDHYAYVTLNDSSACLGGVANELQIIDISDVANATQIKFYQLTHPVGLSKDGNILFVCDGKDGLKIYNADDVKNLQLIKQIKDAVDYDVVAQNGIAIVVASNGIYEYDYSDLANIHLISSL